MRIAREALPFVLTSAFLAAAAWLLLGGWAATPFVIFLLFCLWFFRDPERLVPDEPGALISPADGKVILAGPERVSIFMNVFDVHVCRAPAAGRVESVDHRSGRFMAAFRDEAPSQNERNTILLADAERRIRFTLIAGLIARRIVCKVRPGEVLSAGQRVGLIRFGSRVDVELPSGSRVEVTIGGRVVAGETILARLPGPE
jgi:phosphatidylserine decarboxylase